MNALIIELDYKQPNDKVKEDLIKIEESAMNDRAAA